MTLELSWVVEYHTAMLSRLTRVLVLLVAFVALQASVLGASAAYALGVQHAMADGAPSGGLRHAPAMPGGTSTSVAIPSAAPAGSSSGLAAAKAPGGEAPCDHESAPQQCAAMPACWLFVGAPSVRPNVPGMPAMCVAPAVALAPALVALPPELPPPRA